MQTNYRQLSVLTALLILSGCSGGSDGGTDGATNTAPQFTSPQAVEMIENSLEVMQVTASDTEGDAITFSVAAGVDATHFDINATTGVLSFKTAPDFEQAGDAGADNIYEVELQVADSKGATALQTLAVSVADKERPLMHKHFSSDIALGDYFGWGVAIDSGRMVVGAPYDDDQVNASGSAYIFDYNGTEWVESAKLTASDAANNDLFGRNGIAIDGDRIVIGAPYDDDQGSSSGSAYIFDYNGTGWIESAKLTASDGIANDNFGDTVAVSGNTVVIGQYKDSTYSGAVYIYDYNGTNWIETKVTNPAPADYNYFGSRLAIDGNKIVIGAKRDDTLGIDSGLVYIYEHDGSSWAETVQLSASDFSASDHFGSSVAIKGNRIIVGTPDDDDLVAGSGSVYIYDYDGTQWLETKITASDPLLGDQFGYNVALAEDFIAVNAYNVDDAGIIDTGAVYLYAFDGTQWTERTKLTSSTPYKSQRFGQFMALDSTTLAVGDIHDHTKGNYAGTVSLYAHTLSDEMAPQIHSTAQLKESIVTTLSRVDANDSLDGHAQLGLTYTLAGGDDAALFSVDENGTLINLSPLDYEAPSDSNGDGYYDLLLNVSDGTHLTTQSVSVSVEDQTLIETTKLTDLSGNLADQFSNCLAVEGNRTVVGVPYSDDNGSASGSVYVYDYDGTNWSATKLIPSDAVGGKVFGSSVNIYGDRIVVGATGDNSSTGAAYVFDYDGSSWQESAKLTPATGNTYDYFGSSVDVEGDRVVIGAIYADTATIATTGAAYIYDYNGTAWAETKLTASDAALNDYFGENVAISTDRVVIGAYADDDSFSSSGSVYLYDYNGTHWNETKLTASNPQTSQYFGYSVAIENNTIAVGSYGDSEASSLAGAVHVYDYNGATWVETKLLASDPTRARLGASVAIKGNRIAAGAPEKINGTIENNGGAYIFDFNGTGWAETILEPAIPVYNNKFGRSIGIGDGFVAIGAQAGTEAKGAVHIFHEDPNQP